VPVRKDLRLSGFDYTFHGPYFVTVCMRNRRCHLGAVVDEDVVLSRIGRIVERQIELLPERLRVQLDECVVMPNHVHLVVGLRTRARQASPSRLGTVIGSMKSGSAREAGIPLWQRGYFDYVIRDEGDLERVREYIRTNPIRWAPDPEIPANLS
jgi:REP element-mobilizing transposase RayT